MLYLFQAGDYCCCYCCWGGRALHTLCTYHIVGVRLATLAAALVLWAYIYILFRMGRSVTLVGLVSQTVTSG